MYKIVNKKKLLATAVADKIGSAIFAPWRLFRPSCPIDRDSIKNILVIRTAYIGDVVMTLPLLKPLRAGFPGARISFLTSHHASEILRGHPHVDEILSYDAFWFYAGQKTSECWRLVKTLRQRRFDLVVEARADIRDILFLVWPLRARYKVSYGVGGGAYLLTHVAPYQGLTHKVDYHLGLARYLQCPVDGCEWGVHLTEEEKEHARSLLAHRGIPGPFVAVHPGTRLPLKRWRPERYAELCDRVIQRTQMPLILLGTREEGDVVAEIVRSMKETPVSLVGDTGLRELACILEAAAIFICNDSAPMHIAVSLGTPIVALFGPSKSVETGPYSENSRVAEKPMPCRVVCDENRCRHSRYHACMEELTVADVIREVEEVLKRHV